ncbi:unnamed protein product [Gongylonema pulchrum]|uniref:Glyco_hydro_18 domain-containing protein n=1 Tax=Gongylonema pulchrum TaxID=637853 RepID=A0A183D5B4_9BILA|nr:unnamed protein product [Gongylonema pulchrum]
MLKAVAQSASKRKHFVEFAIAFLRKHNFDGIDLDWEYPIGVASDHATLVKELKEAFVNEAVRSGRERLLQTAAVSAGKDTIDASYDIPSLKR